MDRGALGGTLCFGIAENAMKFNIEGPNAMGTAIEITRVGTVRITEDYSSVYMAGQWAEPWGGITTAAQSGRNAIKRMCRKDGVIFRSCEPKTMRPQTFKSSLVALITIIVLGTLGRVFGKESSALRSEFYRELKSIHQAYRFPGATAAFILPEGGTETVAVGLADIEKKRPMKPSSRMLAASIGKSFVGAAALALVEEGRLRLDEPVSNHLHDRAWFSRVPNHDVVTLRQLLSHTSGIPNHVESERFAENFQKGAFAGNHCPAPESLLSYIFDQPALFEPGHGWYYSDSGYLLVGILIEAVTGNTFYEEVSRRFLDPLNLHLTAPSNRRTIPDLATGYVDEKNPFGLPLKTTDMKGVMVWHPGVEGAGGGFVSNSMDLVKWGKKLFEGHAVKGDYLKDLLHGVAVSRNADVEYGIATGIHLKGPFGLTYGHGGWIPGYTSSLRYYPRYRIAVAFQINTDIGIVDDSTNLVEELEKRLAQVVIASLEKADSTNAGENNKRRNGHDQK